MLAYSMNGYGLGADAGNADVLQLQKTLKSLASIANYPAADPGTPDGVVGGSTVTAIAMWASKGIPKLPSEVGTVLQIAGAGFDYLPDSMRAQVVSTVTKYAKDITVGLLALMAVYTATTSPPAPPPALTATAIMLPPNQLTKLYKVTGTAAPAGKYKAGSVTRFNTSRNVWSVYSPLMGGYGLGVVSDGRCMGGSCLGEGEVIPAPPAGFVKAGEEVAPPTGVVQAGNEKDAVPFYKNPLYIALAVGGVLAIGTGVYVTRSRKAA